MTRRMRASRARKVSGARSRRLVQIEMQITVANVSVGNQAALGNIVPNPIRRGRNEMRQRVIGSGCRASGWRHRAAALRGLSRGSSTAPHVRARSGNDCIEYDWLKGRGQRLGQQVVELVRCRETVISHRTYHS